MTFPRRAAAITGVHTTVQGKKLGRTEESLKLEAIKGALAEGLGQRALDRLELEGLLGPAQLLALDGRVDPGDRGRPPWEGHALMLKTRRVSGQGYRSIEVSRAGQDPGMGPG